MNYNYVEDRQVILHNLPANFYSYLWVRLICKNHCYEFYHTLYVRCFKIRFCFISVHYFPTKYWTNENPNKSVNALKLLQNRKQNLKRFYRENSTPKDVRILDPQNFSPWRKITQILKSGITHMVTSNGGHTLHHHLRHSSRLSNSLFNIRTTKFQTFTQWLQASAL